MKYIIQPWKNIVNFTGKSTRKEFFLYLAFTFTVWITVNLVAILASYLFEVAALRNYSTSPAPIIFWFFINLPMFALTVRRIRGTGSSPWLFSWYFFPIVGPLVALILCMRKSDQLVQLSNGEVVYEKEYLRTTSTLDEKPYIVAGLVALGAIAMLDGASSSTPTKKTAPTSKTTRIKAPPKLFHENGMPNQKTNIMGRRRSHTRKGGINVRGSQNTYKW